MASTPMKADEAEAINEVLSKAEELSVRHKAASEDFDCDCELCFAMDLHIEVGSPTAVPCPSVPSSLVDAETRADKAEAERERIREALGDKVREHSLLVMKFDELRVWLHDPEPRPASLDDYINGMDHAFNIIRDYLDTGKFPSKTKT